MASQPPAYTTGGIPPNQSTNTNYPNYSNYLPMSGPPSTTPMAPSSSYQFHSSFSSGPSFARTTTAPPATTYNSSISFSSTTAPPTTTTYTNPSSTTAHPPTSTYNSFSPMTPTAPPTSTTTTTMFGGPSNYNSSTSFSSRPLPSSSSYQYSSCYNPTATTTVSPGAYMPTPAPYSTSTATMASSSTTTSSSNSTHYNSYLPISSLSSTPPSSYSHSQHQQQNQQQQQQQQQQNIPLFSAAALGSTDPSLPSFPGRAVSTGSLPLSSTSENGAMTSSSDMTLEDFQRILGKAPLPRTIETTDSPSSQNPSPSLSLSPLSISKPPPSSYLSPTSLSPYSTLPPSSSALSPSYPSSPSPSPSPSPRSISPFSRPTGRTSTSPFPQSNPSFVPTSQIPPSSSSSSSSRPSCYPPPSFPSSSSFQSPSSLPSSLPPSSYPPPPRPSSSPSPSPSPSYPSSLSPSPPPSYPSSLSPSPSPSPSPFLPFPSPSPSPSYPPSLTPSPSPSPSSLSPLPPIPVIGSNSPNEVQGAFDTLNVKSFHSQDLELLRSVGTGSSGTVYESKVEKQVVAVKQINLSSLSSGEIGALIREVRILSRVSHSNIISLIGYNLDHAKHQLNIVMEFSPIGSLESALFGDKRKRFSVAQRLQFIEDIARGLTWLHHGMEPSVIHRDIKPRNILIMTMHNQNPNLHHLQNENYCKREREDEMVYVAKLSDFGFAALDVSSNEEKGVQYGTPFYMAPEALLCTVNDWNKVDVFAFGVTFWETLLVSEVYKNEFQSFDEIIERIGRRGYRPQIPNSLPESVKNLLSSLWAQSPNERPSFLQMERERTIFFAIIDMTIKDEIGAKMWKKTFPYSSEVQIDQFIRSFYSFFNTNYKSGDRTAQTVLRHVLTSMSARSPFESTSVVTANGFGKCLKWFGPLLEDPKAGEILIDRILNLTLQPWFYGWIAEDEISPLLTAKKNGSWLVRFGEVDVPIPISTGSSEDSGKFGSCFYLSVYYNKKVKDHIVIRAGPDCFTFRGQVYSSFLELLENKSVKRAIHLGKGMTESPYQILARRFH